MSKPKLHSKSKRMTCRKKYKIIKKVAEHNRKKRKEEKLKTNKKPKDPGIPNLFPFKEQLLQQIESKKQKDEEDKLKNKEKTIKKKERKRKLEDLQKDAEKRANEFEKRQKAVTIDKESGDSFNERSQKWYYKELKKVVEMADVIVQVLDARDPMGCRCPQIEEMVTAAGVNKKIILLLNKIDLVPKSIVEKWLKYFRNSYPALAFKASTQDQKSKLSQSKVPVELASQDLLKSSSCIGASTLLKLLGNYCRNADIKTSITVGIVGLPNVGKSSVINSLRRSKACSVGAMPGLTKSMQEVQLDKHVKLLDCPGVVMATGSSDMQIILRNAVKIEQIADPVKPVEAILARCEKSHMMEKYCISDYSSAHDFLVLFAKRAGKLRKGGVADTTAAAKLLLQDWNSGKITFYTHPPAEASSSTGEHVEAKVVQYWGTGFDLAAIEKEEKSDLHGLAEVLGSALSLKPSKPVEMDTVKENDDEEEEEEEEKMDDKEDKDIDEDDQENLIVTLKKRQKKSPVEEREKKEPSDGVNVQTNRKNRKALKAKNKMQKKKDGRKATEEGENYSFEAL